MESYLLIVCTRYNDSPDGDWVIGHYPNDGSLIIATAGSGHAYKVCYWIQGVGRIILT
jgi:hypothetical protein